MGNLLSTNDDETDYEDQDIAAYAVPDRVQPGIQPVLQPVQVGQQLRQKVQGRQPVNIRRQFNNPFVDTTVYNRLLKSAPTAFKFFEPKFVLNGRYKCVVISKDSVVYHGGGAMKFNVELPIGIPYYSPNSPMLSATDRSILKDQGLSEADREQFLNLITDRNVTSAYFGPLETAQGYSNSVPGCNYNCLGSFAFKKDTLALDISDEFNIYHLLYDADSPLRQDPIAHRFFGAAYDIKDVSNDAIPKYWDLTVADNPKLKKYMRYTLRNDFNYDGPREPSRPNYFIVPILLEIAKSNGCDALFNGMFTHPIFPRGPELIVGNAHATLYRNYEDPVDWQNRVDIDKILSQPNLNRIYKSMLKYKTLNIDFHAGDLYTHSIWVALYTQRRLLSVYTAREDRWASRLLSAVFELESLAPEKDYELLCKFAVIGAFLHDIGKMGGGHIYYDKPIHPQLGMEYLSLSSNAQIRLENGEKFNPQKLFEELAQKGDIDIQFRLLFMIFIWGIVLFHWHFGDHIRQVNENAPVEIVALNYIRTIREWWDTTLSLNRAEVYQNMFNVFIIVLMIVSACDIQGSELFENSKVGVNERLVVGIKGLPNAPKQHKGGKKFEQFKIDTTGFRLYENVINQLKNRKRQNENDNNASKRNRDID
jgi:hypothetical protein